MTHAAWAEYKKKKIKNHELKGITLSHAPPPSRVYIRDI